LDRNGQALGYPETPIESDYLVVGRFGQDRRTTVRIPLGLNFSLFYKGFCATLRRRLTKVQHGALFVTPTSVPRASGASASRPEYRANNAQPRFLSRHGRGPESRLRAVAPSCIVAGVRVAQPRAAYRRHADRKNSAPNCAREVPSATYRLHRATEPYGEISVSNPRKPDGIVAIWLFCHRKS
jgi:hypothetical protein